MKNLPLLILSALLIVPFTGCVNCGSEHRTAYADCGCHDRNHAYAWFCDDGYTFSYDPYNRDMLAPTLALDPMFPPPYIPCYNYNY